jgi:ferritin-like metal-binding protein YciE
MGLFSKPIKTLDDLFVHTLQDMYYAEQAIAKSLPKMAQKAAQAELRNAFEKHLQETRNQVVRLERVFEMHGVPVKGATCPAINGIIEEAEELISDVSDPEVLDAGLISAAQAVEHYEITRYGTLAAFARRLGREDCAHILEETLAEEKAADKKLTELAELRVNQRAAAE